MNEHYNWESVVLSKIQEALQLDRAEQRMAVQVMEDACKTGRNITSKESKALPYIITDNITKET